MHASKHASSVKGSRHTILASPSAICGRVVSHKQHCILQAARHNELPEFTAKTSSITSSNVNRVKSCSVSAVRGDVASTPQVRSAKDVIYQYYDAYNAGDIETVEKLLAEDCSYHDMIYEEPFRGRAEIAAYLRKVRGIVPSDLKFVIEDATEGDPYKVGIMWHVECGEGVVFPFSRGCSFYTLNQQGQIIQARDLVEPSLKPGSSTLQLLAAVTPLVRKLGPDADPANIARLPLAAAGVWAFYALYFGYVMFSTTAPGLPVWQTPPETLQEVFYLSLNFFYINIGLNAVGVDMVPSIPSHPVYEALFNFMNAWSLMTLPLILTDGKCDKVNNKLAWWTGIMFLTNVFYIPFLALRAAPEPEPAVPPGQPRGPVPRPPPTKPLPGWAPAFGATSAVVGGLSLVWALAARPEYGDLASRVEYFQNMFSSDRVFWAFIVDAGLYSIWQSVLMQGAEARYRYVPFFGLAAHLLSPLTGAKQKPEGKV
mmetsp:Transcript_14205/g.30781  ORF Transcript_14205/g.30781 Transcript_14205/m.30781 type:complete len:484 (+) Transcript_14205:63-1514(+)